MITYAELWNADMSPLVDAEGSQRYLPEQDIIPSINSAVQRAMSAVGWAMANRKGSEEAMRELTRMVIFQTNSQGGIRLDDPALGHGIWNILGIYARPETVQTASILPLSPDQSLYRDDLAWSGSGSPVERVTLEEVPMIRNNVFRNGNEVLASNPSRVTFSYYIVGGTSSPGSTPAWNPGGAELRVLPKSVTASQLIAMSYLKEPTLMVDENSTIEFPQSMRRTLASWALQYLAIPQGDNTTLYTTAEKDASELFQLGAVA